jgi:hypothetical protein
MNLKRRTQDQKGMVILKWFIMTVPVLAIIVGSHIKTVENLATVTEQVKSKTTIKEVRTEFVPVESFDITVDMLSGKIDDLKSTQSDNHNNLMDAIKEIKKD